MQIIKSHSQLFKEILYLTFLENFSITLYSLQLEDTVDNCGNVAIVIINKITRSSNVVTLGGTSTNNSEWFEIQLNILFWSANSGDHLQRKYLQT